jgi:hypothetical protein
VKVYAGDLGNISCPRSLAGAWRESPVASIPPQPRCREDMITPPRSASDCATARDDGVAEGCPALATANWHLEVNDWIHFLLLRRWGLE